MTASPDCSQPTSLGSGGEREVFVTPAAPTVVIHLMLQPSERAHALFAFVLCPSKSTPTSPTAADALSIMGAKPPCPTPELSPLAAYVHPTSPFASPASTNATIRTATPVKPDSTSAQLVHLAPHANPTTSIADGHATTTLASPTPLTPTSPAAPSALAHQERPYHPPTSSNWSSSTPPPWRIWHPSRLQQRGTAATHNMAP